ncbi:ParB/RepB/Spo0J family partition protein [candidate division KSB1 bacterium]|nr:ParB/RepB/Spo0J family partition protein [candidate division KSB1 bacterium]RQW10993.1 MAG: ParB/RepB/Spo0J family partition protein [candidate division KSB1 bacterium]
MTNRKALGRGLSALIPDVTAESQERKDSIQFIRVNRISPNPFQPRELFDSEKLAELANSIAEKGVVQPITVRRHGDGYQIIAGERRFRCVRDLGIREIPAYVLDVKSDAEMMELSIIENIHREDLNPIDIANGYRRLIEECRLTQEQVAQKVGKDRATISNFLRLLKLPRQIQQSAQKGDLSMGHARALLAVTKTEDQLALWKKIISANLSVRQVERAVKKLDEPLEKTNFQETTRFSAYMQDAEDRLQKALATKVRLKAKGAGGAIEIIYYDDDDLDRLINRIVSE